MTDQPAVAYNGVLREVDGQPGTSTTDWCRDRPTRPPLVLPVMQDGPMAGGCRFCEIAAGRTAEESTVIVRDEHVVAFPAATQRPFSRGHVLVIPRAHVQTIYELDGVDHAPVLAGLAKVSRAVRALPGINGLWVEQHNEPAAFQSVDHLHFHLIPFRRRADVLRNIVPPILPVSIERRERQAQAVRAAIEG